MEMRALIRDLLPGRRWLALAAAVALTAGVATPLLAQTVSLSRWTMPANVQDIALDSFDDVWVQTNGMDGLRELDPATKELTTYTTAGVSHATAITVDGADNVWSPGSITGAEVVQVISRLDPITLEVTSWPAGFTAVSVAVDSLGNAWFLSATNTISRLVPATDTVTRWKLPFDISFGGFDASDRPLFSYVAGTEWGLARLDPATNAFTNWPVTTDPDTVQRPSVDGAFNLWAVLRHSVGEDAIIRLNPATDTITEWTCRPGCDQLTDVVVDALGNVWFTEDFPTSRFISTIGRLDPTTPPAFTEWQLTCPNLGSSSSICDRTPRSPLVDSAGDIWMRIIGTSFNPTTEIVRLRP